MSEELAPVRDIKETAEVLRFVLNLAKSFAVSLEDGKMNLMDVTNFIDSFSEAGKAFEGISEVIGELKDLTGEELDALKAILIADFPVDIKGAENIINVAFNAGSAILELVRWFKVKKA